MEDTNGGSKERLYELLVSYLSQDTRFNKLENREDYLDAIAEQVFETEDTSEEVIEILKDLKMELDEDLEDEEDTPAVEELPMKNSEMNEAKQKILAETAALLEMSEKLKEAPDWMDMKDMNLFLDQDGTYYVKNLRQRLENWKKELKDPKLAALIETKLAESGVKDAEISRKDKVNDVDTGTLVYDSKKRQPYIEGIDLESEEGDVKDEL